MLRAVREPGRACSRGKDSSGKWTEVKIPAFSDVRTNWRLTLRGETPIVFRTNPGISRHTSAQDRKVGLSRLILDVGASMVVCLNKLAEKSQEIPHAETIYCLHFSVCRFGNSDLRSG